MDSPAPTIETILAEAVEIPDPTARAAYLDAACRGDPALRVKVGRLADNHFRAGSFLEHSPAALAVAPTADYDPAAGYLGAAVGPYRVRELIGEGGMGLVYVADQEQPVKRRVALKVIKPGMDTREVVARFEAERQALALMDHPGIAKVFDGGATAEGRPYFVMELVRGLPLTEYCDRARLPARDRLVLFTDVCRAVQHAHQKGVIHRDLKPTNVLVTVIDGRPVPRVIDFGVAKATGARLTDKTAYTGFARLVGTPLYMSPEQAELSGVDVDTRSDVYSLGVLLYELLTGTTPFDGEALRAAGFDEMRRIIREEEPPRPSHRVSTLGAAARSTVSSRRGLDGRQLGRLLSGDLDWIAMKALEKDRNRRYESAGAFAADVERYLAHEPVAARPPSAAYRCRKFVRRNRAKLAAAVVLLTAGLSVAGTIGWTAYTRSAERAEAARRAVEFRDEADRLMQRGRWAEALAAVERAEAVLGETAGDTDLRETVARWKRDLRFVLKLEETRLEIMTFDNERSNADYGRAFRDYGIDVDDMPLEEAAARLPGEPVRGEIVSALDDWALLRRGRENPGWLRVVAAAHSADPDSWRSRVRAAWQQGDRIAIWELARTADLERESSASILFLAAQLDSINAVSVLRKALLHRPGDLWLNWAIASWLLDQKPSQTAEAIGFLRAALAVRPESPRLLVRTADVHNALELTDEAIELYRRAIQIKPDYAAAHVNLSGVLAAQGQFREAESVAREAILRQPDYAEAYGRLGKALLELGRFEDSLAAFRRCHELGSARPEWFLPSQKWIEQAQAAIVAKAHGPSAASKPVEPGPNHEAELDQQIAASREDLKRSPNDMACHFILAELLAEKGAWAEAIGTYRACIQSFPNNYEPYNNLVTLLAHCPDRAMRDYPEALRFARQALERDVESTACWYTLAAANYRVGSWGEAIAAFEKSMRLAPRQAQPYCALAEVFAHCPDERFRDLPRAVGLAKRATELAPEDGSFWCILGTVQYRVKDWKAAAAALEKGIPGQRHSDGTEWFYLAMARWRLGDKDRARQAYDRAVPLMEKLAPKDPDMLLLRNEAAKLLRIDGKP